MLGTPAYIKSMAEGLQHNLHIQYSDNKEGRNICLLVNSRLGLILKCKIPRCKATLLKMTMTAVQAAALTMLNLTALWKPQCSICLTEKDI